MSIGQLGSQSQHRVSPVRNVISPHAGVHDRSLTVRAAGAPRRLVWAGQRRGVRSRPVKLDARSVRNRRESALPNAVDGGFVRWCLQPRGDLDRGSAGQLTACATPNADSGIVRNVRETTPIGGSVVHSFGLGIGVTGRN